MTDLVRQEIATSADTVVIKVGSNVLTASDGRLSVERVHELVEQIEQLLDQGRRVALVSSGAVAAGMGQLAMDRRPGDLAQLQAVAAVGQTHLVQCYDRALRGHGRHAAQVLLTAEDFDDRTRYLNVRNTLLTLMDLGCVPIINENDTVAVDELQTTFGDNDQLAALVTNLLAAPLLVLLSDVDGLYDGAPSDPSSRVIHSVPRIDETVRALVCEETSQLGKGGMSSKLMAAEIASRAGENVIIASGRDSSVLPRIFKGQIVGTLIPALGKTISPWKRWLGFSAKSRGQLILDDGACRAIREQGRSLLPIGVIQIDGRFDKGDVVSLVDRTGAELARGLINYTAAEMASIQGLKSDQIATQLGHCPYEECIHRNNLVLTE